MKLILTACLMLATFLSAGAATMQPEKFHAGESRIMPAQQMIRTRALLSGYLFVGPALKKAPADTTGYGANTVAPKAAPQTMTKATSVPQTGNSGARSQ